MIDWDEFIQPHIDAGSEFAELLRSEAMFNAVYAEQQTVGEARDRVDKVILLLMWIKNVQARGVLDTRKLAGSIEQVRQERKVTIDHIISAAFEAPAPYQEQLFSIASKLKGDWEIAPPLLGKRGAAAANDAGAWAGWCIRELDALLSPEAKNRYAAISHILGFVGLQRSPTLIRSLLMKGKT